MMKEWRSMGHLRLPIISASAMIFNQASTAIFGVFLAAHLRAEAYGTLNLCRNFFMIALVMTPLGLDIALQRHIGGRPESHGLAAEVFWSRLASILFSLTVVVAIVEGGASYLTQLGFSGRHFTIVLILMIAALPFASDMAVLGGVYRGLAKPLPAIITNYVIQPAARIIIVSILLLYLEGIWAAVYGTLIAYILAWLVLATLSSRNLPLSVRHLKPGLTAARHILGYSPILGFATLIFTATRALDTIFLGYFAEISDVGRYGVALMVGQLVAMIGSSVGQTVGARFSAAGKAGDYERLMFLLSENIRITSILCAPLCVEIALWGTDIDLLLGPSYKIAPTVFIFVATSQFVQTVTQNCGWPLVAAGRQRLELFNNVLAFFIQIIACLALIPFFGATGAALSTLLALSGMAIFRQFQLARVFGKRIVTTSVLTPLLISFALAIPVFLLQKQMPFRAWWMTGIIVTTHMVLSFAAVTYFLMPEIFSKFISTKSRAP